MRNDHTTKKKKRNKTETKEKLGFLPVQLNLDTGVSIKADRLHGKVIQNGRLLTKPCVLSFISRSYISQQLF